MSSIHKTLCPLPTPDLDHVLVHGGPAWTALRKSRIFVTGGTGFFGKWILESFLHANRKLGLQAEVTVLSRNPDGFLNESPHLRGVEGIKWVQGDVENFELPNAQSNSQFTHFIHAATSTDARLYASSPRQMIKTMIAGTERVLELASLSGSPRFLLTSSGAVYGRQPGNLTHLSENHLTGPDPLLSGSSYGESKRLSEHLCVLASQGFFSSPVVARPSLQSLPSSQIQPIIARCFAFIGPHLPLDQHFAIGNFIRDGRAGKPVQVGGDGTPYRSYLHAADLMAWLWRLLARGEVGRAYNVGSDQDLTIRELAEKVARYYGVPFEIAKTPDPTREVERYVPKIDRIKKELGAEVWIPFENALERTESWLMHKLGPASKVPAGWG